jgi:predicted CopG family antitoxin
MIELKTNYLPVSTKKMICEQIVNNCIVDNDGIITIDYIAKQSAIDISLVQFYSNIDLNESDLDSLYADGIIDELRRNMPTSELKFIETNVYYMLQEIKELNNSLSGVINRQLSKLINRIPDSKEINKMIPKISKAIEKLNPDTIKAINNISSGAIK